MLAIPATMDTTTALTLAGICLIVTGAIALWCGHLWAANDKLRDEMDAARLQEFVKGIRIGRHMAELQQHERVQMDLDGSNTKPALRIVPSVAAPEPERWYDVTMQSDEGA